MDFSLIFLSISFLYPLENQRNGVPGHFGLSLSRINVDAQTREKRWVTVCRIVGAGPCKAHDQCCSNFCAKNETCQIATNTTDTETEESRIGQRRKGERCTADSQCRSGCCNPVKMKCGDKRRMCLSDEPKQKKNGARCSLDSECKSRCCNPDSNPYTCKDKKYTCIRDIQKKKKKNGSRCKEDSECESTCCNPDSNPYTCKARKYTCVRDVEKKKVRGDYCTAHRQCISNCCIRHCNLSSLCVYKCAYSSFC